MTDVRVMLGIALVSFVGCKGVGTPATDPVELAPRPMVSIGLVACAITSNGALTCWGNGDDDPNDDIAGGSVDDLLDAPSGTFHMVSVMDDRNAACAIRTSGELVCWGDANQAPNLSGAFKHVSATSGVCVVDLDGAPSCFDDNGPRTDIPPGPVERMVPLGLDLVPYGFCAVSADNSVSCVGVVDAPADELVGPVDEVSVGWVGSACGRSNTNAFCEASESFVVSDPVVRLALDPGQRPCGVTSDGDARCWATDSVDNIPQPDRATPNGSWVHVASANRRRCAISDLDEVHCWAPGDDWSIVADNPFVR